ncbi:MAG TPA: 2Fe-2S iron-sulfur cluster-binding protein [Bacteroidales bacterium]|nr:2Fe-2S iron-sulfur cluster-binding protein [Bacteroidales bacterium]HPS49608.1 2Fe-2S iron-sulfur cluster-binding protein [Bacteroidales bacterium]
MKITIDHHRIEAIEGMTVMEAAAAAGIVIPAMCHIAGVHNHPSCMVCLVKDIGRNQFIPSCSCLVEDEMLIQTHSPEIRELRREALELLLSDHVGDCEAPCQRSCPAHMDIPRMNRLIANNRLQDALDLVREEIALPWILGYICPAPCEKACRRGTIDQPVSVCLLKRITAEDDSRRGNNLLIKAPRTGKRVAIIGTGPAGLSAAFYLLRSGHGCTLFDQHSDPGGMLRSHIPEERLPRHVLDAEIDVIRNMGAEFRMNARIDDRRFEETLLHDFDALILATGNEEQKILHDFGLILDEEGIRVSRTTFGATHPGIFACGTPASKNQMAVRSVAQGKNAARSADHFLRTGKPHGPMKKFNSSFGILWETEFETYLVEGSRDKRTEPAGGLRSGFTTGEAIREAARCMHCDCRRQEDCKLRNYAGEYQAHQKRFIGPERKMITKVSGHPMVVYESEKCIKCGLCVAITSREKEPIGLSYIGRGFDVRINVPLKGSILEALTRTAEKVVQSCPTGALAWKSK